MVRLLAPAFYALGDTQSPVTTAAAAFVANLIFSVWRWAVRPGRPGRGFIADITNAGIR
jgi:peptidoglycan biosynthesis protein MviN/MurJ (putative lipid II flippase)